MFEELIQETGTRVGGDDENDGDIEMGGSYTSIDSEPDIHLNQIVDAGSPENTRIANRVLRRLLKKNREIKERTFVLTLMGFLFDGFMIFSYYEICQRDRQCRYDIVVTTTAATTVWVALIAYHIYLYVHYRELRDNIIRGISI